MGVGAGVLDIGPGAVRLAVARLLVGVPGAARLCVLLDLSPSKLDFRALPRVGLGFIELALRPSISVVFLAPAGLVLVD